ncbi:MAG: glutaredoxin family protein [Bacillota bacterium]
MNSVTVFTMKKCPNCLMMKNFLHGKFIDFIEINVESNPEIIQELVKSTGHKEVPQTKVNGKWVIGYEPELVNEAFNKQ